jgi:two-component system, cell cycle sensor histidine kinase and response regulator CckA
MMDNETIQVLLVEDSPSDAMIVQEALSEVSGVRFAVTHVERLSEALQILGQRRFAVVLLDLSLPDSEGFGTFTQLRDAASDIPVVVLSGRTDEVLAVRAVQSGAQDYLVKGHLEEQVLARAIRYAIERQRSEEALRMQSRVLESMVEGVNVSDQDGLILFSNAASDAMFGYAHGSLIGKPVAILSGLSPDDTRDSAAQIDEEIGRTGSWSGEIAGRKGDGASVLTLAKITSLEIGGRKCAVAVHEDITEKKQLELHLLSAQRLESIGQLAAGVAHDFNNILGVIMGYCELINGTLVPGSESQKYAGEILQASERAVALTRQLLIFSRKETVQPLNLDLNKVVEDTERMLRRVVDESVELTILAAKDLGCIKADAGHIGQVLTNLVVNARDAMPNGGALTIATANVTLEARSHEEAAAGDYVLLTVSDSGSGMTDEVKARLFEVFFTTKPQGKGTGLGLATCHTIVKQCGGYIDVQSDLGKGTTFKIYFPRIDAAPDAAEEFLKIGPLLRGTETLLLVEDEPSLRHLAMNVLEAQGYTVLRANNGQDGLNVARNQKGAPISLVITDVIMPQMNGKVMADWLKTTSPDLRILFTSGYTDEAIAHHGVLEPGVAFLPKPYTPATLTRKVREMLDEKDGSQILPQ